MTPRSARNLYQLLAIFRAVHWSHWTSHWTAKGPAAFEDHLLFERLYKALEGEIDTLGEKLTAYGAPPSAEGLMGESLRFLRVHAEDATPAQTAYAMEKHLQEALLKVGEVLKEEGDLSLGLDDFLSSAANDHETALYLLGQKLTPPSG